MKKKKSLKDRALSYCRNKDWFGFSVAEMRALAWIAGYKAAIRDKGKRK